MYKHKIAASYQIIDLATFLRISLILMNWFNISVHVFVAVFLRYSIKM